MGWGNGLMTLYGPRVTTLGGLNLPTWGATGSLGIKNLLSLLISPDPATYTTTVGVLQLTATGSYDDLSTQNDTENSDWTISTTEFWTLSNSPGTKGQLTVTTWGQINGGSAGVTASISTVSDDVVARVISFDSSSLRVFLPQSDAQWVALGLSPWGGWWGCQEGSGSDLVGSGSVSFTLTANNAAQAARCMWRKPEANWTRVGVEVSGGGGTATGFFANAGTGPNIQTTSVALLGYLRLTAPAGAAKFQFGYSGPASNFQMFGLNQQVSGVPRLAVSGNFVSINGGVSHDDGRIHPVLLVRDVTNNRNKMYTDINFCTGSSPATALYDGFKGFGGGTGIVPCTGTMVYMAYCTGSVAEALSDNGKAAVFLKTLGWTNISY